MMEVSGRDFQIISDVLTTVDMNLRTVDVRRASGAEEMHQGCDFFRLAQAVHGDLLIDDQFGPGRQDRRLDLTRCNRIDGVWGAMEPKTNVSSESHRKGAFRSPAHPPGITL
jgi:predicted TIM-barrel enzyme